QNYIKNIKDGNISSLRGTLFSTANRRAPPLHVNRPYVVMIMEDCSRQIAERLFWGHGHVERDDDDEDED
ncbi:unnamed protein product, partial [Porites evermanni]